VSRVAGLVVKFACMSGGAFAAPLVSDNFEAGAGQWSAAGTWGLTAAAAASPVNSMTDSPGAFYANNTDAASTLAVAVDLSAQPRPVLAFLHRYSLEQGFDFGRVEVSTNGGASWSAPVATWTGEKNAFGAEQLDLSAYASSGSFKVRFRLSSDGSVVRDGWYVDDVRIGSAPAEVVLDTPGSAGRNSVTLAWSAAGSGDFAAYEIYRAMSPAVDWRCAWKAGTVTNREAPAFTDAALAPKTTYYYRLAVVSPEGLRSFSNEVSVTTQAGMDFPMLDNGEAGAAIWTADAPWALSAELAASGSHAWSDSPDAAYAPSISSQALTLAAPVDLTSTTDPVLCFNHRYDLAGGDYGYVEVSTNNGTDWASLSTLSGSSPGSDWQRARISLAGYRQAAVLVRFRFTSDPGAVADGWHMDDISLTESPPTVAAPAVDQITSNSARLTWQQSPDPLVTHYAVFRSTSTGSGINSTLCAMVNGVATTSWTEGGLLLDSNYYYRVYAVNSYGGYSADSPTEAMVHTLNHPPPFSDGFEAGTSGWIFSGTWGVTAEDAASGAKCLTDSPVASYLPGKGTWAETSVDLRGTEWPVLKFKDRYALAGGDWLRVDVYDANQTWYQMSPYGVYESTPRTQWREQQIDLSPFKGRANVRIRFHLDTDGATPGDGWFIDDVSVTENALAAVALTMPFEEGFEAGLSQWIAAGWITTDAVSAKDGTRFAWDTEPERMAPDSTQALTLAHPVVLPAGSNAQVTLWVNGIVNPGSWFRLQYSEDGGLNWPALASANLDAVFNSGTEWWRLQASLQSLAGKTVRLRLISNSDYAARAEDVRVDKLTIAEMPAAVTLSSAVPALRSVALTWTASTLGTAFQRYEVWRSTSPNITVFNGTKLYESTAPATTTFSDTGLGIGATYYYRVFLVDTRDTFIPSNEMTAVTVPSGMPFADSMETMGNWVPGSTVAPNTWGIATTGMHGGSGCLALSPAGQYANSSETWVETAVDLSTAVWPVLKFWDRYALGEGDWLRVEVYDGNQTWFTMNPHGVHGPDVRSSWREQQLDLSMFKGRSNIRIRFRVATDAATPADGWFIDDLTLTENPLAATPQPLPLQEGFESGLGNWIAAGWISSDAVSAKDGTKSAWDTDALRMGPDTNQALTLARAVVLPAGSNVQVTFWVNGIVNPGAWFRLQYSEDGGLNWPDLASANLDGGFNPGTEWRRLQASLQSLAGKTVRLRLISNSDYAARTEDVRVDKLTIAEMPAAVTLTSAVPALRSVALTWTPSTLGTAFQRYEVWRSTSPNITVFNGTKLFESANVASNAFTDTGLGIGNTYYYRVFTLDERDTFIPSNEMTAVTVPSGMPFADAMETMGNWVPGSTAAPNTWGIATTGMHGGSGCLALAPTGQYAISSETWVETAVDLSTAVWPVLKFWDRYALGEGDWLRVEVYDGNQTWVAMSPHGVHGPDVRSTWREQQLDLSMLKGRSNIRIRFRVATDGATPADGWFIDDLTLTENPLAATPQPLPLQEGFESGLGNWIAAGWISADAVSAKDGTKYAWDTEALRMGPDTNQALTLARPVVLPAGSNVQVTFAVNGIVNPGAWFRLQYSEDGGLNWPDLASANLDAGFNPGTEWRRLQASLQSLAGKTVRLRLISNSDYAARAEDVRVDKLTIAEMPAAVTLTSAVPALRSVALTWTPSTLGTAFQRYEVWRSTTVNVTVFNGTKVFDSSLAATTAFTDSALLIGQTYYYRVFAVDERDTFIPSNELTATTLPSLLPFEDPLENLGNWMAGGTGVPNTWGIATTGTHGGSGCLALAPIGQYANSSDTWVETSVNLSGATWPVLKFWDRYALGGGDWLRVEIYDGNQTWYWKARYGVYGAPTRADWREQQIDLSEFKGRANVRVRFRVSTDGNTPAEGWFIDDLSITENTRAELPLSLPFLETSETGPAAMWQASGWARVADATAPSGGYVLQDTENANCGPDTDNSLTLTQPLVLPADTTASLTFWVRGTLPPGSWFRLQYSQDGGVNWPDLSAANLDAGFNTATWQRIQVPLAPVAGKTVRLRFLSSSDYAARASDIFLDNIGIGEPAPLAPLPLSPVASAWVSDVRPQLTLQNAVDVQSDPLTYRFEVYSDEALTTVVAQVPAVAGGSGSTAWTVDVNLPNNSRYWWRARANDGTAIGQWSAAADFYVNEVNHVPATVLQTGPPNGAVVFGLTERLFWLAATDADAGDFITAYHIQISRSADFILPVVDVANITPPPTAAVLANPNLAIALGDLPASGLLEQGGAYFWRIRASDNRLGWSAWQSSPRYFRFLTHQPTGYENWQAIYFTADELNTPGVSGANADADGDGVPNLLEFASNTHPHSALSRALPVVKRSDNSVQIAFRQRRGGTGTTGVDYIADDVQYTVEWSDNLAANSWTSGHGVVELVPGSAVDNGDDTDTVTVRSMLPMGASTAQFLRLRVTSQAP
jgi:hypothetical protein